MSDLKCSIFRTKGCDSGTLSGGPGVLGALVPESCSTVDSNKLEFGPGSIYGCPSSLGFGVGGESSSNFLASTVRYLDQRLCCKGVLYCFEP